MSLSSREFLVREVGERIADLLQDRERAISLEQYQKHSEWIIEELLRIERPTEAWFKANRAPAP